MNDAGLRMRVQGRRISVEPTAFGPWRLLTRIVTASFGWTSPVVQTTSTLVAPAPTDACPWIPDGWSTISAWCSVPPVSWMVRCRSFAARPVVLKAVT